jgi:hypothetical protein
MEVRAIQSARAQESDVSDLFGKMYKRLSHTIFTLVSVLESMPDTKMFARQLRLLAAGEDGEPTEDPADSFDED